MTSNSDHGPVAVLVVDDDMLVRMISSDILTDAGFQVIEAHDAQEAMILLQARTDVQVLFTDWNMPGDIDGMGLARVVRRLWPDMDVIVTSGKTYPEPGELPAGVRFLKKPFRPSALIQEVKAMVQGSDTIIQGASVLPEGLRMLSPVTAEVGGIGIAAAQPEPDKT